VLLRCLLGHCRLLVSPLTLASEDLVPRVERDAKRRQ
jgi:hypothetical protein